MTSSSGGVLRELIDTHREQAEEGHERLRRDLRALERRMEKSEDDRATTGRRLDRLEQTPLNVEKVAFSTKQLLAIVGAALVLAGGMWRLQVGINDVQVAVTNAAKLQDERTATQREDVNQLRAAIEMRRVEIQRLSDKLTEYMQQKGSK